jgi:hypothetical protein
MINESRAMKGTLTLGATGTEVDLSCQVTNVRITSAYSDDGDSVTTLCGDTKPAPRKLDGHKLEGTIVQDFDYDETAGGVIDYLWNHNLEMVAYAFTPNDQALVSITGTLQIEIPAETYGGDVNKRVTSDFVWNLQEDPTRTYTGGATQARSGQAATVAA